MNEFVSAGLELPPGVDPIDFYLRLPAMSLSRVLVGADMRMIMDGLD
jgi:hypothetical protein